MSKNLEKHYWMLFDNSWKIVKNEALDHKDVVISLKKHFHTGSENQELIIVIVRIL